LIQDLISLIELNSFLVNLLISLKHGSGLLIKENSLIVELLVLEAQLVLLLVKLVQQILLELLLLLNPLESISILLLSDFKLLECLVILFLLDSDLLKSLHVGLVLSLKFKLGCLLLSDNFLVFGLSKLLFVFLLLCLVLSGTLCLGLSLNLKLCGLGQQHF
jgi:hypothetical protein